jgi:hypothetical protein
MDLTRLERTRDASSHLGDSAARNASLERRTCSADVLERWPWPWILDLTQLADVQINPDDRSPALTFISLRTSIAAIGQRTCHPTELPEPPASTSPPRAPM